MTYGNVIGPDVSFYQDDNNTPQKVDFNKMKSAGAEFVIIRVGQNNWVDSDFADNWRNAKAAGLPRGAYWFYDSRSTPESQAALFMQTVGSDKPELYMFADFEERYDGTYHGWQNFKKFLEALKPYFPGRVAIYTAFYYWLEHRPPIGPDLDYFKTYHLWVANYQTTSPLIPGPWTRAVFWQYTNTGDGVKYGAESLEIDLNRYDGTLEQFRVEFGLTTTPPPPPAGLPYRLDINLDGYKPVTVTGELEKA